MTYSLDAAQAAHAAAMVGEVQRRGLPQRAAVIVIETAIVESNIQIYANPNVPASMAIPHEAEGTDHASVGILQQQVPSWGTAADCMNPALSTGKFLDGAGNNPGLLTLPAYRLGNVGYPAATNWDQIPTGSAAQAVQVSAFPDRYQEHEADATAIVQRFWTLHATDTATAAPIPKSEEDDMILILKAGTAGGFWLSGGKALISMSNAERLQHIKAGGVTRTWSAAEFDRALQAWR